MGYYDVLSFGTVNKQIRSIIDNNGFWIMKYQHDYHHILSVDNVRQKYFSEHDKINYVEESDVYNHLPKIFERMRFLERNSGNKVRIYFSGECDSNQTDFERMSNHLQVGVMAKNPHVAYAMLRIVRAIIDHNEYALELELEEIGHYKELIQSYCDDEITHSCSFKLTDRLRRTLTGCVMKSGKPKIIKNKIQRDISEVDIWTLPRLEASEDF